MNNWRLGDFMEVGQSPGRPHCDRHAVLPTDKLLVQQLPYRPPRHVFEHAELLAALVAHAHDAHEIWVPEAREHAHFCVELPISLSHESMPSTFESISASVDQLCGFHVAQEVTEIPYLA